MWIALLLAGCELPAELRDDPPPRDCAERQAFWPDSDGDGVGEPTAVWIGCDAPPGWVPAGDLETGETGAP